VKKRILGRTEIEVSELSFGCVEIGIPYGIGVVNQSDMLAESQAVKLLQKALSSGINFFDTARSYGRSEKLIGEAFKNCRNDVIISTKCMHLRDRMGKLPAAGELKKIIDNSLMESLSSLNTDYVDVYMCHDANIKTIDNQIIAETFCQCRKKGMARAIGVSTYTAQETERAIQSGIWDVVQLAFNLMDQRQGSLFPLAASRNVAIVVRSVLLKGVLTDKASHLHPELKAVEQHRKVYEELLTSETPTLFDLAVKFVLSHSEISSALIGIDKMDYLQKALGAADGNYLNEKIFSIAKQLAYPDPDFLDLPKWDRMGWLK